MRLLLQAHFLFPAIFEKSVDFAESVCYNIVKLKIGGNKSMDDYGYDIPERFKAALEEWKRDNPDIQKLCEELDNKVIIKEVM